jgi:hypothetical protein
LSVFAFTKCFYSLPFAQNSVIEFKTPNSNKV